MNYERGRRQAEKISDFFDRRRKFKTQVLPCDEQSYLKAKELMDKGEVVAVATETVYGLAASAFHDRAVQRIFLAKGRPQDNPLIVHISSIGMLYPLVTEIPPQLELLANRFWPGPLTIVMKKSGLISDIITAGMDTVAIRMPSHPSVKRLIEVCGYPLAAPSANTSGAPSPTSAKYVLEDLGGKIPLILDGGDCSVGVESTVVSLAGETPILLRPGAVTLEQLRQVLGEVKVAKGVNEPPAAGEKPLSPGMSYRHYSPKAKVTLYVGSAEGFTTAAGGGEYDFAICFDAEGEKCGLPYESLGESDNAATAQQRVFSALRHADERGAAHVIARCPAKDGDWLALFNRLQRSAGFEVIGDE